MNPVFLALDSLLTRFVNLYQMEQGSLPKVSFDPPWPSECTLTEGQPEDTHERYWRPVPRKEKSLFQDLESALSLSFPEEIKHFYGSFWSNGLCVEAGPLPFNLIQIWNHEDEQRLKENLLGHLFARQKNRLPLTYFIGSTDGNDIVSLDHESGQVVLEKPGYKAHRILSESLETFLLSLNPTNDSYSA